MATQNGKSDNSIANHVRELAPGEVVIGELQGFSESAEPLVNFPHNGSARPVLAMSTLALGKEHVGREVALLFTAGDLNRPLIIGLIHSALQCLIENFEAQAQPPEEVDRIEASIDGKRVVIEGQDEVVLKCGASSITLTKSGKIVIRGKNILNRSTGLNRILGGSVQIN